MINIVPWLILFSIHIFPICWSMICLQIYNPNPKDSSPKVPSRLICGLRSNNLALNSSGIPIPLSAILIWMVFSSESNSCIDISLAGELNLIALLNKLSKTRRIFSRLIGIGTDLRSVMSCWLFSFALYCSNVTDSRISLSNSVSILLILSCQF